MLKRPNQRQKSLEREFPRSRPVRSGVAVRSGVTVLEFIIVLPIFLIALMGTVELGLLISNEQPLEMSTRAGALLATQTPLPTSGQVPNEIIDAIGRELENIGIDIDTAIQNGQCKIMLEHNVDPNSGDDLDPASVLITGTLVCPDPVLPPPPDPDTTPYGRRYVRLTVCLQTDLLTPNLLKTYCLDISTRVTQLSKTYRYVL